MMSGISSSSSSPSADAPAPKPALIAAVLAALAAVPELVVPALDAAEKGGAAVALERGAKVAGSGAGLDAAA